MMVKEDIPFSNRERCKLGIPVCVGETLLHIVGVRAVIVSAVAITVVIVIRSRLHPVERDLHLGMVTAK